MQKDSNQNQNTINSIVNFFFNLQFSMKLYHWNTLCFSRHKSSDSFLDKLLDITDKFVEVFIGRYKVRPMLSSINTDPNIINDERIVNLLTESRKFLEQFNDIIKDYELLTIRDDLLLEINQTLYLFTLR